MRTLMPERLRRSSQSPTRWVTTEIRVRYAETDQMGVAYYSNYLVWFEVGRSEACRDRGFSYAEMEADTQAYLAVAEARCRYHSPARYDEVLQVRTAIESLRSRTVNFRYEIVRKNGGVLVATGSTTHIVLDRNGRPKTLPEKYASLLKS